MSVLRSTNLLRSSTIVLTTYYVVLLNMGVNLGRAAGPHKQPDVDPTANKRKCHNTTTVSLAL